MDTAYFAGGCFWGVEYYLEQAKGVISVESGYLSSHQTGHAEAVQVVYDPSKTAYEEVEVIFRNP